MDAAARILQYLEEALTVEDDAQWFVLEVRANGNNAVEVFVDSDDGITLRDCTRISRILNGRLNDEEIEDISFDVSSPGVDRPLELIRQYPKHIGRHLRVVRTSGEKVPGKLVSVKDDTVYIQTKSEETMKIDFNNIRHAFVELRF